MMGTRFRFNFALIRLVSGGWFIIVLSVILGGITGRVISSSLFPIYEARAEIYLHIDSGWAAGHQQIHEFSIPEIYLSSLTRPIWGLFYSSDVIAQVIQSAEAQGISLAKEEFLDRFWIEYLYNVWFLRVRSTSPQDAMHLANLWQEIGLQAYRQAYRHALQAGFLEQKRQLVVHCLDGRPFAEANLCAGTQFATLEQMSVFLDSLSAQIEQERLQARGIEPALMLEAGQPATIPSEPVAYMTGLWMVGGALIGFLVGLGIFSLLRLTVP